MKASGDLRIAGVGADYSNDKLITNLELRITGIYELRMSNYGVVYREVVHL